jgi:hypothetical protein
MRAKHITPDHVAAQGETSVQRFALASALLLGATVCVFAQTVPPGYPADYQAIIAAAEQEGSVVVYSTTDSASADVLLKDFRALYPKVQIRHHDLNSTEVYNRYLSETAANAETRRRAVERLDGPAARAGGCAVARQRHSGSRRPGAGAAAGRAHLAGLASVIRLEAVYARV